MYILHKFTGRILVSLYVYANISILFDVAFIDVAFLIYIYSRSLLAMQADV